MSPVPLEEFAALSAWELGECRLTSLGQGLINQTWLVTAPGGGRWVLQRVNPVFPAAVNADIERVARRVAAAGLETPRLVPVPDGRLWLEREGAVWRLMTWLDGESRDSLADGAQAAAAGRLLGRFHRALDGLAGDFANPRLGVHDTVRHLRVLGEALAQHRDHARYSEIEPLAREIIERASALPHLPATPDRVVHGDPKINNMLFDPATGEGRALIDLDTVGRMPLPLELGDALRSWCNPRGENARSGIFSPELFRGALQGYAECAGDWITDEECAGVLPATLTIITELAARFCADALNERYFAWDPDQFASRSEHNQVRAAGQLTLARSCAAQYDVLHEIVDEVLGQAQACGRP